MIIEYFTGMAVKDRRKDSFLTYPVETTQTIESLTDAGYFYAAGKMSLGS